MREFRRRRSDAAEAQLGSQADREPIHILTPLSEIRLDDTRAEVAMQGFDQRSQTLLSCPRVRPPILDDLRLAIHVASNDATTAGRSSRRRDTRSCPRNVLTAC